MSQTFNGHTALECGWFWHESKITDIQQHCAAKKPIYFKCGIFPSFGEDVSLQVCAANGEDAQSSPSVPPTPQTTSNNEEDAQSSPSVRPTAEKLQTTWNNAKYGFKQLASNFDCANGDVVTNKKLLKQDENGKTVVAWSYQCLRAPESCTSHTTEFVDAQWGAKMLAQDSFQCANGQVITDAKIERGWNGENGCTGDCNNSTLRQSFKCCDESSFECSAEHKTTFRSISTPADLVDAEVSCPEHLAVTDVKMVRGWNNSNGCGAKAEDVCNNSAIAHTYRCCQQR